VAFSGFHGKKVGEGIFRKASIAGPHKNKMLYSPRKSSMMVGEIHEMIPPAMSRMPAM
jgi:hypothetical protein